MIGFLSIKMLNIPRRCLEKAFEVMRSAGKDYIEGVALFAGSSKGNEFHVTETIIPKQEAYSFEIGLMYNVDAEELHRINVWLYENNLTIIAQIHSHPNEAFHSSTDDTYPIVATKGGISIVVPRFASGPIDINSWAVYRLSSDNSWVELTNSEVNELIHITED